MMKEEQNVYICCLQYLYRIKLSEFSSNKPPLETVLDFVKEELPIGSGFFVADKDEEVDEDDPEPEPEPEPSTKKKKKQQLYMVGGEILRKGDSVDDIVMGGLIPATYRGQPPVDWRTLFNENIFLSFDDDDDSRRCRFKISNVIPTLKAPKPNPIIATIDGKIYVLAGLANYFRPDNGHRSTTFEVYDPAITPWNIISIKIIGFQ